MLSLILYGRNDSHGYNLHKRAAISLNAIAEVVSHADDEIIFVDYNTPDELPTFLETIADTLTERAKRLIRIIRVRPEFHKRYARQTSLVALESQSRNIAIRRANAANRWILSTNTDMIFVPARRDESLSDICARIPDGFYHLPRFELPEGFWERADRLNPVGIIVQMRSFGKRYHLNEIVYGGFDNVYEAPGDFQLFLREDLQHIRGFDETMIKGWHVDTNTARRMKLLRGKVDSLFPEIYGYHCGHTRQATSLHGARRTENSLDTYARNLTSPFWTTEDSWGAPDEVFEEIRLTESRTTLFLAAMNQAIPYEGPEYTEATYNESTYCAEGFDAAHILPHVGDVLFNQKPGQTVFMVGSDLELMSGFSKFITSPPMNASFFVCSDEHSPGPEFSAPSLSLTEGLERADILVLQYPNHRTAPADQRADLQWFAQKALEQIIDAERKRDRSDRRRVIVINGMHSLLQDLLGDALDAAAAPFSARLRQGRVFDPHWPIHPPIDSVGADKPAYASLGRIRSFSADELQLLSKVFASSQDDPSVDGWERLAPEIVALARQRDFVQNRLGANLGAVARLEEKAREHIRQAEARVAAPLVDVPPRPDTTNRICSSNDWESSDWAALAIRYFGERAYSQVTRSRWLWERISLIHELRRRVPTIERPWVLVVSEGPDPIAAMAAHQGFRVAYANTDSLLADTPTAPWLDAFRMFNIVLPGSIVPLDKVPSGVSFAAMLAPGSTLFWRERERAHNVIAKVAAFMTSGAHLGVSALVHINSSRSGGALSLSEFEQAFTPNGVMSQLSISGDAPVDARIPLDTAVRFAVNDREAESAPGLSFSFSPDSNISLAVMWGRFPSAAVQTTPARVLPPRTVNTAPSPQLAKTSTTTPLPSAAAVPARNTPSLEAASAFAATMLGRIIAFPAVFTSLRRNLLSSVVSTHILERSAIRLLLGPDVDGCVRFGVPIADVGPYVVSVHIALAGVSEPEALSAIFLGENGSAQGVVTGSRGILMVRFETAERLGNGLAVFEVGAQTLEVSVLSAARDSAAMTIA